MDNRSRWASFCGRLAVAVPIVWLALSGAAFGQVTFIPPNDPVGHVFTTNSNDGWDVSRGVVFQVTSTQALNSIGLLQDVTGVNISYEIDQTTSASGDLSVGKTVLRSGSGTFTTSGLQFITFSITPLTLQAGNFYQIRFQFSGNSNQNFFYDNSNVVFSQPGFSQIDGTQTDDTGNSVMPAVEINGSGPSATAVPALSTAGLSLLGLLLAAAALIALRRRS